jgi:hypothetical protein
MELHSGIKSGIFPKKQVIEKSAQYGEKELPSSRFFLVEA